MSIFGLTENDIDPGLIIRGSTYHQTDTTNVQGGSIDLSKKIFIQNTPFIDSVTLESNSPLDIDQTYLIEGISEFNRPISEEITLNGSSSVSTLEEFAIIDRVKKVSGSDLTGVVTISTGTTDIGTLEPDLIYLPEAVEILNILANSPSNPFNPKTYYEKIFLYNPSNTNIDVTLSEKSDPKSCVEFSLDPTVNGSTTSTNRLTPPAGFVFDSSTKTETICQNESLGVWFQVNFGAGSLATSKFFQMKIAENILVPSFGGFGEANFGVIDFGGEPDLSDEAERIITFISKHAGGRSLTESLGIRNSHPVGGGNPLQFIELLNGKMVAELAFEPDPVTFRDQFYYNTRINQLFKKINSDPFPVWKSAR